MLSGNGDGTFQNATQTTLSYGVNVYGTMVGVGDFNGDGRVDLALSIWGAVGVFLGEGDMTVSPGSLTFGAQAVGTTSTAQEVTITNSGSVNLTITNINTTGANSSDFGVNSAALPISLTPGGTATIQVTFNPQAAGSRSGNLSITEDASSSPQNVALAGIGTAPSVTLSPTSLAFGNQPVNTASVTQNVTLTNTGGADLIISGITASVEFRQTNNCTSPLAPDSSCTISVTFAPTAAGAQTGTVSIADNAANSPQTIALSGTGTDFAISASPGSRTVKAGKSTTYSVSVAPLSGFNKAVALSCSGAPTGATCGITPASVTLNGTSSSSATATIATGSGKKGTPKGTYVLTFTAAYGGTLFHSATATLIIQ